MTGPNIPENWPNRASSRLVEAAGLRWHVQEAGHGPVVLLLHGTAGSTHQWAGVIPRLTPHARVVAPDLPGHAFTHVPPAVDRERNVFSLAGMARAVAELCRAMNVQPDLIVGHSAGAAVALRLVLDGHLAPRSGVLGFNPALVPPPELYVSLVAPLLAPVVESRFVSGLAARLAGGTRLLDAMLDSSGSTLTPAQRATYRDLCRHEEHVAAAIAMMSRWDVHTLLRDAAALAVPFRALAGARDTWVPRGPLAASVARIPGATFEVVNDVGHLIPDEMPDVAANAILQMLPSRAS
jgi:magnesium chelatase accessory protein